MKSDASRIQDLNILYDALQRPRSVAHKEYLEKMMDRILRESKSTRELRDKLVKATRAGDINAKNYYINELIKERKNEIGTGRDYLDIKI